jgi:hypothetical protein
MAQETWLVVSVGAGFLLLGIAASPLGWVALLHRRANADREEERRSRELGDQLRALRTRVERCESTLRALREEVVASELLPSAGSPTAFPSGPIARRRSGRHPVPAMDGIGEPKLITVPKLPAAQDRQAMHGGLSQRYAAIWELAESGASPDAIARATGQPIGQIELILGLRRQMDAGRTNIPHAAHE